MGRTLNAIVNRLGEKSTAPPLCLALAPPHRSHRDAGVAKSREVLNKPGLERAGAVIGITG